MSCLLIFAILLMFLLSKSLCVEDTAKIGIITYENQNAVPGQYHFKFESTDGTFREETGEITNPESDNAVVVIRGLYSYVSPDGKRYTVRYVADDQGFRPELSKPTGGKSNKRILPLRGIGGAAVSALQGGGLG